jgi:hypothetical protein
MLRRGETAVVSGFNLGSATAGYTTAISLSTATPSTTNVTAPTDFGLTGTPAVARYRQFTVNNAQETGNGMVTLTVTNTRGNFPAVNAGTIPGTPVRNRVVQPWNTEYRLDKEEESRLWDDFTSVHIWQSNGNTGGTDNGVFVSTPNWVILNPAMSINPNDGVLYASYNEGGVQGGNDGGPGGNTSNGAFLMGSANNVTGDPTRLMYFRDPMIHSDVYRTATDTWMVTSIIGQSTSAGGGYVWRSYGGIFIYGPDGEAVDLSYTTTNPGAINQLNKEKKFYYAESTWYNAAQYSPRTANPPSTDQFLNPHIVTSGTNDANIHVSYYDSKDGSIKYRYNRRNSPGTIDNPANSQGDGQSSVDTVELIPKMWTNLDGGYDTDDTLATTYSYTTGNIGAGARVVNLSSRPTGGTGDDGSVKSNNAGEHNAIAVTSQGYPVVAYFDATRQRLKLAVSNTVDPVLADKWVIRDKVIPDGPYQNGTGEYVSIAIDTTNTIHIAAMNAASGNLVYIKGQLNLTGWSGNSNQADADAANNVLTNVTVHVVDSIGTVGRWCNISLDDQGRPWIAYQDAGYIGAKDGVKLAYLNTTRFTKGTVATYNASEQGEDIDVYGKSVSGWETMHVPTDFKVENPSTATGEHGRIGLENFPSIRNTTAEKSGILKFAAVSYLGTDTATGQQKYRIAYYVK